MVYPKFASIKTSKTYCWSGRWFVMADHLRGIRRRPARGCNFSCGFCHMPHPIASCRENHYRYWPAAFLEFAINQFDRGNTNPVSCNSVYLKWAGVFCPPFLVAAGTDIGTLFRRSVDCNDDFFGCFGVSSLELWCPFWFLEVTCNGFESGAQF